MKMLAVSLLLCLTGCAGMPITFSGSYFGVTPAGNNFNLGFTLPVGTSTGKQAVKAQP